MSLGSEKNTSQDSVTTHLKDGGIFSYCIVKSSLSIPWVKEFGNLSACSKVLGKNVVAPFCQRQCIVNDNKNSSGDDIAYVNFYAVRPGSYKH